MHAGETYQLNARTVAIQAADGRTIVELPSGTLVTVADAPPEDSWFISVGCCGTALMMFRIDLLERGQLIKQATSAGGRSRATTA
jgi:hypothetical protein